MRKIKNVLVGMILQSMRDQQRKIENGEQVIKECTMFEKSKTLTEIKLIADLDGWCEDEFNRTFHNVLGFETDEFIGKTIQEARRMIRRSESVYEKSTNETRKIIDKCRIKKTGKEGLYEIEVIVNQDCWDEEKILLGTYCKLSELNYDVINEQATFDRTSFIGKNIKEAKEYLKKANELYNKILNGEQIITTCMIKPYRDRPENGCNEIIVTSGIDGNCVRQETIATYFTDELIFTEDEFVGKTMKEAEALIVKKNKDYLR